MPQPSTATVRPRPSSAPRWAWESMPRAMPLTTVTPFSASPWANSRAARWPSRVQRREPTTASARSSSWGHSPRTSSVAGGSYMPVSAAG